MIVLSYRFLWRRRRLDTSREFQCSGTETTGSQFYWLWRSLSAQFWSRLRRAYGYLSPSPLWYDETSARWSARAWSRGCHGCVCWSTQLCDKEPSDLWTYSNFSCLHLSFCILIFLCWCPLLTYPDQSNPKPNIYLPYFATSSCVSAFWPACRSGYYHCSSFFTSSSPSDFTVNNTSR